MRTFMYAVGILLMLAWPDGIESQSIINMANFNGPSFSSEPPSRLVISSGSGGRATCTARGNPQPQVSWLAADGMPLMHISGLRQVMDNGTLVLQSFPALRYRNDVHATTYRCRAANSAGVVLSREMRVATVIDEPWEPVVNSPPSQIGGIAVLTCSVSGPVGNYIKVASWLKDGSPLPQTSDPGSTHVIMSAVNQLAVRLVNRDDLKSSFSCDVLNPLNGERKRSKPAIISITENVSSMAPRLSTIPADIVADQGTDVHLVCSAIAQPPATYSWYRASIGGQMLPVSTSLRMSVNQEMLYIRRVEPEDEGSWICKAYNQYGEQHQEVRINVISPLSVEIKPNFHIANTGSSVKYTCTASGTPSASIRWLHNGVPVHGASADATLGQRHNSHELVIRGVTRADRGIYQCLVTNGREDSVAQAELRLGDIAPEMQYTFIEQALRQGPAISLKCSASGTPPPTFAWLLDGKPISEYNLGHGLAVDQYASENGEVVSHLNISSVRTQDGGLYTCQAVNTMGKIEHSSRLNIYGPPSIRSQGPTRSVAGSNATVFCPYYGYPISSIVWSRRGHEIKRGNRFTFDSDGSLYIANIDSTTDSGSYTCTVASPDGDISKRDIEIIIKNPPKLVPFSFPSDLGEGSSVQLLCGMTTGDRPVYFSWLKDGSPIPSNLQIQEKSLGEFSLLIFSDLTSKHSGDYTCVASNIAAKVNHTSKLMVKVSPSWLFEPQDMSILVGNPVIVHCKAQGFPEPNVLWQKVQGVDVQPIGSNDIRYMVMQNGSLFISETAAHHEGKYVCKAENGIGTGLSKTINLRVNEPVRFEETSKNLSARRNDPILLICHVYGDHPIQIHWSHNLKSLEVNSYRLSTSEVRTDSGLKSQITFTSTERQDSGVYKCQAENAFGRSEHLIYLTVQERPDAPTAVEVVTTSSRSTMLTWRQGFDGHAALRGYRVQYRVLGSVRTDDWHAANQYNISMDNIAPKNKKDSTENLESMEYEAVISSLKPAAAYAIRLSAYNDIDESAFSEPIVIKTQEEAPAEAPSNVHLQANSPGELVVSWKAPTHDSWNGDLIGYLISWSEFKVTNLLPTSNATNLMSVKGWSTSEITLNGLKTFTRYEVGVRAFNIIAAGPPSISVFATTLEGVPRVPPSNVNCVSMSSHSIKVFWDLLAPADMGGLLQGFKIVYNAVEHDEELWPSVKEIKRTSGTDNYLQNLRKATNHSIQVFAYTGAGDGVKSLPVFCSTHEDTPGPPASIKAMALATDTIVVSWLPPELRNGRILRYIIYCREAGRIGRHKQKSVPATEGESLKRSLESYSTEVNGLRENQLYEFWVTAVTTPGEGESSSIVAQGPNPRAISRISSFAATVRVALGQGLSLPCVVVGRPAPRVHWTSPALQPRYQVDSKNTLVIGGIDPGQGGNYTCSVRNPYGSDSITYNVIVAKPPSVPAPRLRTLGSDRIIVAWPPVYDGGAPIKGYQLHYKQSSEKTWSKVELPADAQTFTIDDLSCGTSYDIFLVAFNGVGKGQASETITSSTKGGVAKSPSENEFITTNITTAKLNFLMWDNGGCLIEHFLIEYRDFGGVDWLTKKAILSIEGYTVVGLTAATWYSLKITAKSGAGSTVAKYYFSTYSPDGVKIAAPAVFPLDWEGDAMAKSQFTNIMTMVLALGLLMVFATLTTVTYLMTQNKRSHMLGRVLNEFPNINTEEDKSRENQDNQRNYQQVYTSSPNKNELTDVPIEIYDISPYATFTMPVSGADDIGTEGGNTLLMDLEPSIQLRTFGLFEKQNVPGKSKWTGIMKGKSRPYDTEGEYNLSKASLKTAGSVSSVGSKTRKPSRSHSRGSNALHVSTKVAEESDSESSEGPCNQCKVKPSYRLPINANINEPDSSTESSSPVERGPACALGTSVEKSRGQAHAHSTPRRSTSRPHDHERANSARYSQRHEQERRDFIIHV